MFDFCSQAQTPNCQMLPSRRTSTTATSGPVASVGTREAPDGEAGAEVQTRDGGAGAPQPSPPTQLAQVCYISLFFSGQSTW